MPEKDGDEGKSTKSVVNKKQKQMMGEEGYDIARDMGRVKPSKDKKDGTTMTPSAEMKKTQKVNKGPSAFERVKAKYGKSVMNVGKKKANEELDLTQVAEALGGYIVEAPLRSLTGDPEEIEKRIKKGAEEASKKRVQQGAKKLAKDAGIKLTTQSPEQAAATQAAKDIGQDDMTPDVRKGLQSVAAGKGKAEPSKPRGRRAQRVKGASGEKPTGNIARGTYKSSPAGQKAYDAKKADIEARRGFAGARTIDTKGKVKRISGLKDDERNQYVDRDFRQDRATEPDPFDTPTADPKKMFPFGKAPVTGGLPMGEPTLPSKNQKTFKQFDRDRSDLRQAIRNLRTSKERMGQVSPVQQRKKLEREKQDRQSAFNRQQRQYQTDYMGGDFGMGQPEAPSSQLSRQKVTDFTTGKETEKMAPEKGGAIIVHGSDKKRNQKSGEELVRGLPKLVKPTPIRNALATAEIATKRYAKYTRKNPALSFMSYDIGKGIVGKAFKALQNTISGIRSATRIQGGKTGSRSAKGGGGA